MGANKPGTKHFSTPKSERHRKPVTLTLSDEEVAKLEALAKKHGVSKSQVVGDLIMAAR